MADNKKCAHPGCNCTTTDGGKYCGAYCEGRADQTEIMCECGHGGCEMESATA